MTDNKFTIIDIGADNDDDIIEFMEGRWYLILSYVEGLKKNMSFLEKWKISWASVMNMEWNKLKKATFKLLATNNFDCKPCLYVLNNFATSETLIRLRKLDFRCAASLITILLTNKIPAIITDMSHNKKQVLFTLLA